MPKVSAENPKRFKTFESFFKPKIVRLHTQKVVLTTSWRLLAKSLKIFCSNSEKVLKRKTKKTNSSAIFTLDTQKEFWEPCQMFLQKIRNDSKFLKKFQAKNCSSAHTEVSFDNFLKFFGQKSEKKVSLKIRKKTWKEK